MLIGKFFSKTRPVIAGFYKRTALFRGKQLYTVIVPAMSRCAGAK